MGQTADLSLHHQYHTAESREMESKCELLHLKSRRIQFLFTMVATLLHMIFFKQSLLV